MATYFLNSEWAALTAGTVVEVTGGTAVIGTDAFASAEGLTVAAGDTVAYEGGTFDSIYSAEGVTAKINKNITYTGDTLTLSGITVNADTIDTAAAVITCTGDASSSNVNYGMVTVLGGTNAGGYVVDGDLYIKNNVYYNDSDLTAETTTVDVGGATFAAVWGGTASFSADKTLYNNNSSAAFPALSSSIGSDGVLVVLGGTYSYVMGEYFKGAETIFAAGNVDLYRYYFLGGTYTEDQYVTISGTTFSSRPNHITQAMALAEGVDAYVKYDNVVSLTGTTFARIGMVVNGGTFHFEAKKSYFASLVGVAHSEAHLGTMDVSLIGSTVASGEMVFGTMSTNNANDMKTHSVSGDIVLNVSDSYIGAKVIGGHAYGTFPYNKKEPGYTCSVDGSIKMTFTGATLNGDIYGSDIKDEADNVTSSTIGGNIVITIDNSSAKNIYGNGFADLTGNVNITIANGANVTGDVKGYYDTDNVKGSISLTVTGKNNNVSGAISNFEEINISAGATLTVASIAHTGTITIDVTGRTGKVKVIDAKDAFTYGKIELVNVGANTVEYVFDETNNDLYINVVVDRENIYINDSWTGADEDGFVTLTNGSKAVWGVNAFATVEDAVAEADGKPVVIDGGVYNNPSLAGTAEYAVVTYTVDGVTYSGRYGENVFSKTTAAELESLTGAGKTLIMSGTYDVSGWGDLFSLRSDTVIIENAQFVTSDKTAALHILRSSDSGYAAVRNVTIDKNVLTRFAMLYGVDTESDVTIDLENVYTNRNIDLTRSSATVGNLTLNVIGGSFSAITDRQNLTVNGLLTVNLVGVNTTGNVNVLSNGSKADNLCIILDNCVEVGNITAYSGTGVIAEGGVATLVVKGNNETYNISAFDNIIISAGATLTATSITHTGTITIDVAGITESVKVIDVRAASTYGNIVLVNKGDAIVDVRVGDDNDVYLVKVDTDTIYVNSDWSAEDADANGLITLADGGKAVWDVNAFNNTADAKEAAGDKAVVIEGGSYSSLSGLAELVITGDVTITDWTGVTSVTVKNGATITTNSWSNTVSLTIEAAGNNFSAPVINYIGSGSVSYGDVAVTGDDAVKSIVLGNKLYAGSDIIYNDPALAGKTAGDVVEFTVNGEKYSGIYGTDVFSYSSKSALNGLSGANKVVILAGTYEPSVLGSSGFGAVGNVIYDGMQIPSADGTAGQALQIFCGTMTYDVHGVIQNTEVTSTSLNRFVMLAGSTVHGNAVVDLKNLSSVTKTVQLSRGTSDVLGDFSLNVIGSTVNSAISDVQTLRVTGNICLSVSNSTVGDVTLLNAATSTASNLSVTIDNSTIGSLSGYNNKVEAASLTVKGISITGAVAGFDYITISAGATLTATSITHAGTITIDVAGITDSYKVIDGSTNSTYGNIVLVNKGDAVVNVRVGDDNDVYLDVVKVITDTVYVNNNWEAEDADPNGLITLSDGNKAAWCVNAFASVGEAMAAANGRPVVIDGGVYNDATGLTDLTVTGDATINDWSGVTGVTVKNGATVTTNNWSGTTGFNVDAAKDFDAAKPVINYTGSGEVTFGKVNFVNGSGAAYAVGGKLYAGSNVIYNNPAYTADTEIVLGGVTFTGVYGENIFNYTNVNDLNSITGADKVTVFTGSYDSAVWSASGFNPAGNITVFDGATVTTQNDQADWTNRIYLARNDRAGADIYGAVLNSDMSKTAYFYAMYNVVNGGDMTVDIANSKMYNLYLMRGTGDVDNLTINVTNSEFVSGISDTGHIVVDGELVLNITGSTVGGNINLMQAANTNISKITVSITDSTVYGVYASSAGKAEIGQDELILNGTVYAGTIDNFETVTITAGAVIDAHKINTGTLNITLGEITEDICIIDTDTFLRYGTLNVTNADALPAGFELIEFNGDLWAVNTSDPTKVIGREVAVGDVAVGDAFEGVTITNNIFGAKADAGEVDVEFSMKNTVAKSIVGGGSNANAVIDTIKINLNDTTFDTFYGGGYNAETGTIETELNCVRAMKMVYGGNVVNSNKSGNSTDSTVGSVSLTIIGGRFENQVVGGGRVVASAGSTTAGDVCSTIGEVVFTVKSDEKGFSAVFNDSVFGAGYVIGNHSEYRAELSVGSVTMELNGASMNSNGKPSHGIYAGGMASGNASITVGTNVQTLAVVEADEAVYLSVVSGSYTSIYGGGWAEKGASVIVKGVAIEVKGGDIENLYGGGNNDQSGARTFIDGDVFITISGGSIDNVYAGAKFVTSKVKGSSTIQITGNATIGTLCGLTSNGYDSVLEEQSLDVDAALKCNSISGFDIIDIAEGKDVDIASAFDLSGVELNIAEQTAGWDVLCATELIGLAEALVTLNGQEATWNGSMFASADYMLSIQENTVKNQTTYSLVFGKLA